MDAVEYLKQKNRMTNNCTIACNTCPLAIENNNRNLVCANFERHYIEEAVAAVENWAKERPEKTYKSVFLEMFPNVKTTKEGHPDFCLKRLLGAKGEDDICSCDITCGDCWNREVEK